MPFDSETAKAAKAKAAGRGESKLKKLFKEYADADDVKGLFDVLKDKAMGGDMDAIKTLLGYLIGKPKETVEMNHSGGLTMIWQDAEYGSDYNKENEGLKQEPGSLSIEEVQGDSQPGINEIG